MKSISGFKSTELEKMSGYHSPSTASKESNTSNETTFIGTIDAADISDATTATSFDKRGSKDVEKENLKNKMEKEEAAEEKERPKKKRRGNSSDEAALSVSNKAGTKSSSITSGKFSLEVQLSAARITRLEAELAAALTTVAHLKSENDELKAKMAETAHSLLDVARG